MKGEFWESEDENKSRNAPRFNGSQFYVGRNVDVDPNVDPTCKYRWMNVFIRDQHLPGD